MENEISKELHIDSEAALLTARQLVRDITTGMGFSITDVTRIITVASELARNIINYAGRGVMRYRRLSVENRTGFEMVFEDHGPGISSIEVAMQRGYSTKKGMGLGLPAAKRLMDEMEIQSEVNRGTTVTVRKWLRD